MPDESHESRRHGRAIWSGTITFGLVSIPVDLVAAIRARETSMKMVDPKGRPLGRQYFCPQDDKPLKADEIVRGYQTDSGKMIVVTDEELASVSPEGSRDIDLRRFVPLEQIPPTYFERPYILAPAGKSTKAYHLLAETMARTARVGIGMFVMRGDEHLVAILSDGTLLRAATLRFGDELRSAEDVGLPKAKKASPKAVKEFGHEIDQLLRDALDMHELSDRYAEALHELVEHKEKSGKDVVHGSALKGDETEPEGADVIDLVKLLRERLSSSAKVTTADRASADGAAAGAAEGDRAARKPARRAGGEPRGAKRSATTRARSVSSDELTALSKEALYERAQTLRIPGRSKMGRSELIAAIRKAA